MRLLRLEEWATLVRRWCAQLFCNSDSVGLPEHNPVKVNVTALFRSGRQQFLVFFIQSPHDGWWSLPILNIKAQPDQRTQIRARKQQLPSCDCLALVLIFHLWPLIQNSYYKQALRQRGYYCLIAVAGFPPAPRFTVTRKKVGVDWVCESNSSHMQSECGYAKVYVTVSAL